MELELFGYVPNWDLLERIVIITGIIGFIAAVIGGIYKLFRRKKSKQDQEKVGKTLEKAEQERDALGTQIEELGNKLDLFIDGMATAPDEARDPYADGLIALYEWRPADARDRFLEALDQTEDYSARGAIHQALGHVYDDLSEFEESRNHYQKALDLAEYGAGDPEGRTWAFNGLGLAEMNLGNYEKALGYHGEGLKIAEEIKNDEARAVHLGNIGLVLMQKGNLEGALEHFDKAKDIHKDIGNRLGEALAVGNIGSVLMFQGDLAGALEAHRDALKIDRDIGNRLGEGRNLGNIGLVLMDRGELDDAMEKFNEAKDIHKDIGNRLGEARQLGNIGSVYGRKDEHAKALKYFEEALAIFVEIGTRIEAEKTRGNIELAKSILEEGGG